MSRLAAEAARPRQPCRMAQGGGGCPDPRELRGVHAGAARHMCAPGAACAPPHLGQRGDWMSYRCRAPSGRPQTPGRDVWGQLTAEVSQAGLHLRLWDIWSVISCFSAEITHTHTHPPTSFFLTRAARRATAERSFSVITDINIDVADLSSSWL